MNMDWNQVKKKDIYTELWAFALQTQVFYLKGHCVIFRGTN